MANNSSAVLGLDVGTVRIGVALAPAGVRVAAPHSVISVDGTEIGVISKLAKDESVHTIVVGYPRNQLGEATSQTVLVEAFGERLQSEDFAVVYQDESLTSVNAEQILKQTRKQYGRGDIDMMAASIILQDYLESHGRN